MGRVAFQLPSGCPQISVDLDILGQLPLCSVPSMAEAPAASRVVIIDPPAVVPVPDCICLDVNIDGTVRASDSSAGSVAGDWAVASAAGGDCCDGRYQLSLDINVPCIPFALGSNALALAMADISTPSGALSVTASACELALGMALDIPYMAFGLDTELVSGSVSTVSGISAGVFELDLDLTKVKPAAGGGAPPVLTLEYSYRIRFPKTSGSAGGVTGYSEGDVITAISYDAESHRLMYKQDKGLTKKAAGSSTWQELLQFYAFDA